MRSAPFSGGAFRVCVPPTFPFRVIEDPKSRCDPDGLQPLLDVISEPPDRPVAKVDLVRDVPEHPRSRFPGHLLNINHTYKRVRQNFFREDMFFI